jgi:hypothetical protein
MTDDVRTIGTNRSICWDCGVHNRIGSSHQRNLFQFFSKPRLRVKKKKLPNYSKKVSMGLMYGQQHEESFDAIIWTIKIQNRYRRISRISKNCSVNVYFDFIGKEFPLKWKKRGYDVPNSFRTDARIDFNGDVRAQFFSYFGKDLVREIFNHADTKVDIPPGVERECYLFTTVPGTNIAFLMLQTYITDIEIDGVFIDAYEEIPLIIRIPSEHTIRVSFVDQITDERKSYNFKLKIKSHAEIELS